MDAKSLEDLDRLIDALWAISTHEIQHWRVIAYAFHVARRHDLAVHLPEFCTWHSKNRLGTSIAGALPSEA